MNPRSKHAPVRTASTADRDDRYEQKGPDITRRPVELEGYLE
jgi:hypothetical protein